jgi:DNA-binding transcriptional ArsR family regulator
LDPLPEEIKRFMDESIESVDQLEILRILGEDPQEEWSVPLLASKVQVEPQTLSSHLAALNSRGLLRAVQRGSDFFCQYGPQTPELEDRVNRLLQLYKERPVTMIRMVYERASKVLQTFADAFKIRKED